MKKNSVSTFPNKLKSFKKDNSDDKSRKLLQLNPFLDDQGLIRVGCQLNHADQSDDIKHPIFLDHKHCLTRLIAEDLHIQLLHARLQLLLSSVRETMPLNGRDLVISVTHTYLNASKRTQTHESSNGSVT